jgi:hypothetical protein
MSHLHARAPFMLTNSFCRDSESTDSSDKGYFWSFRTTRSSHTLREDARPEVVHGFVARSRESRMQRSNR